MCMATAYLIEGSHQMVLLEEVAFIDIDGKSIRARSLFGKKKDFRGVIKEVDFLHSTVLLEKEIPEEDMVG